MRPLGIPGGGALAIFGSPVWARSMRSRPSGPTPPIRSMFLGERMAGAENTRRAAPPQPGQGVVGVTSRWSCQSSKVPQRSQ
jgi:hypothetical protein